MGTSSLLSLPGQYEVITLAVCLLPSKSTDIHKPLQELDNGARPHRHNLVGGCSEVKAPEILFLPQNVFLDSELDGHK
jgi:hypothetical protein